MQLQQIPFYYQVNSQGMVQAAGTVGQHQNIMIPSASAAGGPNAQGLTPLHYQSVYAGRLKCNKIYFISIIVFFSRSTYVQFLSISSSDSESSKRQS
jgi:hypothetical protein